MALDRERFNYLRMENEKGTKEAHGFESNALPIFMEISFTRVRVFPLLSVLMIVLGFVFKPLVRIVGKPYIHAVTLEN